MTMALPLRIRPAFRCEPTGVHYPMAAARGSGFARAPEISQTYGGSAQIGGLRKTQERCCTQ